MPDPVDAVEILGAPGNGTHLFALIPSERAKAALGGKLMAVTGHRHPTAGEVWILDEAEGLLALIRTAED